MSRGRGLGCGACLSWGTDAWLHWPPYLRRFPSKSRLASLSPAKDITATPKIVRLSSEENRSSRRENRYRISVLNGVITSTRREKGQPAFCFVGLSSRSETIRLLAHLGVEVGARSPAAGLFRRVAGLEASYTPGKSGVIAVHGFTTRVEWFLPLPDNLRRRS